jgi:hypothetical protein
MDLLASIGRAFVQAMVKYLVPILFVFVVILGIVVLIFK